MKNISFLIGSGFSVPAGFPNTTRMNERLKKISANEICIHSSGYACFLNGERNPNVYIENFEKRSFVEEFLQFYNTTILESGKEFHYEDFYDYYTQSLYGGEYSKGLSIFLQSFLNKQEFPTNKSDLLFQFNLTFNQLVSNLLDKRLPRGHMSNPYLSCCKAFLNMVEELAKTYIVHLHSLNHDLYIEHLAYSDSIQAKLDDGFEELGSPYYGELWLLDERYEENYTVRLSRFVNKFVQPFRLYKLHGSIDNYWFQDNDRLELIKLRKGIGKTEAFKEVERDGKLQYIFNPLNYYPDFLCGTTAKTERYGRGNYYPTVLNHFKNNLISSKFLIIIGFGFRDQRIKEYIDSYFFTQQDKKMFIVDIKEPKNEYIGRENVYYVNGGVENMDIQFILDKVSQP